MVEDPKSGTGRRRALFRWLGWFVWLNGLLATAVSLRFVPYMGGLEGALARLYLPLALYGHFAVLAAFVAVLVVPMIAVFPRRFPIWILSAAIAGVAVYLLLVDTVLYGYYRFHINAYVVALLLDAGGEVIAFSWVTWLVAAGAFVGLLGVQAVFVALAWHIAQRARRRHAGIYAGAVVIVCVLASHLLHIWADAVYLRPITSLTRHIPIYRPATAKVFLQRAGWIDASEHRETRSLKVKRSTDLSYPLSPLRCTAPPARHNLLLVVIDTWRFDALDPAFTPNISRFASEQPVQRFNSHFSAGNGTRPGIFGLFYGLPASYWQAFYGTETDPVLIRQLQLDGYQTGIFAASRLTRPAFDRTVFSQIPNLRLYSDGTRVWERDQDVLDDWLQFMDDRSDQRPFFGFLFFDSVHAYSFPRSYPRHFDPIWARVDHLQLNDDFDPVPYRNRYNQALHYVDSLVGKALDDLVARGLLDSTVVIITSDHGEAFNDQRRGHWGHGNHYTREQTQVPLLMHWPGQDAATFTHDSSSLDIAPTLLRDLFGCENPYSDYSLGRHLTDSERESLIISAYMEYGIVEPERITVLYQSGDFEFFDRDYRALPEAKLSPEVSRVVLQDMTRFSR